MSEVKPVLSLKETKELLKFAIDFGFACDDALADDKFTFSDFTYFFSLLGEIVPAIQGMKGIPAELEDMTALEMDELVDFIITDLDRNLKREEALLTAKKILGAIKAVYVAYLAIKG